MWGSVSLASHLEHSVEALVISKQVIGGEEQAEVENNAKNSQKHRTVPQSEEFPGSVLGTFEKTQKLTAFSQKSAVGSQEQQPCPSDNKSPG